MEKQAEENLKIAKRYDEFVSMLKRVNDADVPDSLKSLLRDIVKAIYKK